MRKISFLTFLLASQIHFYGYSIEMNDTLRKNNNQTSEESHLITIIPCPPVFTENMSELEYIKRNISYPDSAKKAGIEGRVSVCFYIDKYGRTFDHQVIQKVHPDLDKEALRVCKLLTYKWNCNVSNLIRIRYLIPVDFMIPK